MKYILVLDGGTESIKAVLYDQRGKAAYKSTIRLEFDNPQIREIDQNLYWDLSCRAIRNLTEKFEGDLEDIMAISVTGEGGGLFSLDENGQPYMPAILENDSRTEELLYTVNYKVPGWGKRIHKVLGRKVEQGNTLLLAIWLQKNRPDLYLKLDKIFFAKDWLIYKMTNRLVTDRTDATACYATFANGRIPTDLFSIFGLGHLKKCVPEILPPGVVVGTVLPEVAKNLGLPEHLPVILSATGQVSMAIGAGAVSTQDIAIEFSSTVRTVVVKRFKDCDFNKLHKSFLHYGIGQLCLEASNSLTGIGSITWGEDVLLNGGDIQKMEKLVEAQASGSGGVIYHPYVSTEGELSPFFHPHAQGGFLGIDEHTTKAQLLRAIYEGLSYAVKDSIVDNPAGGQLYLIGEGGQSDVLPQILADVTGRRVGVYEDEDYTSKGAMLTAYVTMGLFENYASATALCCRVEKFYEPKKSVIYTEGFHLFRQLREIYSKTWSKQEKYKILVQKTLAEDEEPEND